MHDYTEIFLRNNSNYESKKLKRKIESTQAKINILNANLGYKLNFGNNRYMRFTVALFDAFLSFRVTSATSLIGISTCES